MANKIRGILEALSSSRFRNLFREINAMAKFLVGNKKAALEKMGLAFDEYDNDIEAHQEMQKFVMSACKMYLDYLFNELKRGSNDVDINFYWVLRQRIDKETYSRQIDQQVVTDMIEQVVIIYRDREADGSLDQAVVEKLEGAVEKSLITFMHHPDKEYKPKELLKEFL